MWIALLVFILLIGAAGIIVRSASAERKSTGNPADAFDIIEDV